MRDRQGAQNDGIDQAEDGGVGPYTEGEREGHHGGEDGLLAQAAEGEAQVAAEVFEQMAGANFANSFLDLFRAAELNPCFPTSFFRGHSGLYFFLSLQLEVGTKLHD